MPVMKLKTTRDFARIWFYWKVPAILLFCVIVFSICLYSFSQIPMYESRAKLMLLPKTNDELVVSAGRGNRQYDIQRVSTADINTEVELIKSTEVLKRTLAYFKQTKGVEEGWGTIEGYSLIDNPLFAKLEVDPVYESNMISVAMESKDQQQVAQVLNKLIQIYIRYHKEMYSVEESEAFYDEQKNFYARRLKEARAALEKFSKMNDISNMSAQVQTNITMLANFRSELQNLEIAIAENEAKIAILEKGVKIKGSEVVLSKEMRNMPVIVELTRGLVPLLIKRTEISKTFTKQSREYQQIDDQIKMLQEEIRRESTGATRTDELELVALKTRSKELADRIKDLRAKNKLFDAKKQELDALELDVEIAKQNYLLYGTKTENSRLYARKNETKLSNIVVAEPGITPEIAKSPKKLLAFEIALVLGFLAAFILPFILETLDNKLKTADDVEYSLSVPVVCSYNVL